MVRSDKPEGNGGGKRIRHHRGKPYQVSEAHPECERYRWMTDQQIDELAADIRDTEQREPIMRLPDGRIIDGRNRELACLVAGVAPQYETIPCAERAVKALVKSLNYHRRHLTPNERRELAADKLRSSPQLSDRAIGADVGLHHLTVGRVRSDLESTGEIIQLEKTTGADGKERKRERMPRSSMPSNVELAYQEAEPKPTAGSDTVIAGVPVDLKPVTPVAGMNEFRVMIEAVENTPALMVHLKAACRRVSIRGPIDAAVVMLVLQAAAGLADMPTAGAIGPWEANAA